MTKNTRRSSLALCFTIVLTAFGVTTISGPLVAAAPLPTLPFHGFSVPNPVVYEIFPRVFSNSGDLRGVTKKLPSIQQLGINVIWLMPIQSPSLLHPNNGYSSPYSIRDINTVNPGYGDDASLLELVQTAHRLGLKIILDFVANHSAWDSVLMQDPTFFLHDADGHIMPPRPEWPDVAQLDHGNPKVREYLIRAMLHWVKTFDVDGFRCDFAEGLPLMFWIEAANRLRAAKPSLFLVAEGSSPRLTESAFDADYAWDSRAVIESVIKGNRPASAIRDYWRSNEARYQKHRSHLWFSDNHDHMRAATFFGDQAAKAALSLVLLLDGIPLIYNGQEVGDRAESAGAALYQRHTIDWSAHQGASSPAETIRLLTELRRYHTALTTGGVEWVSNSNEGNVVSFLRKGESETLLALVNLSPNSIDVTPTLPLELLSKQPTDLLADVTVRDFGTPLAGRTSYMLKPWGFRVLQFGSPRRP